jgi:preprotein translocase subunit SecE
MFGKIAKIPQFFNEVRAEIKKVSWPSKPELMNATIVVIIAAALLTTYIALLDVLFSKLIQMFLR